FFNSIFVICVKHTKKSNNFALMSLADEMYVEILLPLALENTYTYKVPLALSDKISFGKRVEVQFGTRKRYAGLIVNQAAKTPGYRTKEIISVLDTSPLIFPWQYNF